MDGSATHGAPGMEVEAIANLCVAWNKENSEGRKALWNVWITFKAADRQTVAGETSIMEIKGLARRQLIERPEAKD